MADKTTESVEQALAELREMFPRYKYFFLSVSIGAPRVPYEIRIGSAYYSAGVRSFHADTLNEAMDQVRTWREQREVGHDG